MPVCNRRPLIRYTSCHPTSARLSLSALRLEAVIRYDDDTTVAASTLLRCLQRCATADEIPRRGSQMKRNETNSTQSQSHSRLAAEAQQSITPISPQSNTIQNEQLPAITVYECRPNPIKQPSSSVQASMSPNGEPSVPDKKDAELCRVAGACMPDTRGKAHHTGTADDMCMGAPLSTKKQSKAA